MRNPLLTIEQIKQVAETVGKEYGVKRIYLFGSYAKNAATALSDIDLLIEKGTSLSLLGLSGMRIRFEDDLKVPVDLLTTDGTESEFRQEIAGTEVLLYEQ